MALEISIPLWYDYKFNENEFKNCYYGISIPLWYDYKCYAVPNKVNIM